MGDLLAGVIGGMGPDATVDFMARVLKATPAEIDQDHVRLLVDQNPKIPNRQRAILDGSESPGPTLAAIAARLEACDCDFLVMPCNTAHVFADDIRRATSIPLVSIIDVTMDRVGDAGAEKVGLMASRGCLASRVYEDAVESAGLTTISQTADEVDELTELIAEIKTGNHGNNIRERMRLLANALEARGAETIILGCTEIPIVLDQSEMNVPLLSSTDILAEETVLLATGRKSLVYR